MDDDQGRGAAVRDLDQSPPFKPTRLQARANQRPCPVRGRRCFPAGNLACQSPSFAVAEDSRSAKFSRLSKSFLCCCLPASALSWRQPQISILICASRGQEAQNNKPNHGDYRVASSCQSFFFLPVSCTPVGCPAALAIPPVIFTTARPQERRLEGVGLSRQIPSPFSARKCNLDE